jgi:hypothetical protein
LHYPGKTLNHKNYLLIGLTQIISGILGLADLKKTRENPLKKQTIVALILSRDKTSLDNKTYP